MDRSIFVSAGRKVARRWPALVVATVAAAMPVVTFAAGQVSFQDGIIAGRSFFTNGILVSGPGTGSEGIAVTGGSIGVRANSPSGTAVDATNAQFHNAVGVDASGDTVGVRTSSALLGLQASATANSGVGIQAQGNLFGLSATGGAAGVSTSGDQLGLFAFSNTGNGIAARGVAVGVDATSTDANSGIAVQGKGRIGMHAASNNNSVGIALLANGGGVGANVDGTSAGMVSSGGQVGVKSTSATGLGAELSGGEAPVRLMPAATAGAPTAGLHKRGEMYVDSQGQLFLCIADGTPGNWKHVHLD